MLRVEPLRPDDVPTTTQMHLEHLKLGLFPKLGRGFMLRYQDSFRQSPFGIALVARQDDRIVGAVFGTTSNAAHLRWVVRHCGWRLAWAGARGLLVRPRLALRFLTTRGTRYARGILRRLAPTSAEENAEAGPPVSVLSHIITDPQVQRQGIGRRLVAAFAGRAGRHGARSTVLVTEEGGQGAPFFERIGARLTARRSGQDGALLREYGMRLGDVTAYERIVHDRRGRNLVRSRHGRPSAVSGLALAAGRRAS